MLLGVKTHDEGGNIDHLLPHPECRQKRVESEGHHKIKARQPSITVLFNEEEENNPIASKLSPGYIDIKPFINNEIQMVNFSMKHFLVTQ